MLMQYCLQ